MQPTSNKKKSLARILIIDAMPSLFINDLVNMGFECDYLPDIAKEKISSIINAYTVLVIRNKVKIDDVFIDTAQNLKVIARAGSGMENIDVRYAHSKGVKCINAPEGNRDAVGEHTLAMLLALFNKLIAADMEVRQGHWIRENNRGIELNGKTVGIVGYGNMGSAFAQRLQGFNTKVIAYDKIKKNYSHHFAEQVDLKEIFKTADVLSLHVPLTAETTYMVNDGFIKKFSKNIYLINTARGKVINTKDLVENIKSGKILGAALDVLEFENESFEKLVLDNNPYQEWLKYLLESDKVLFSPHVAGITFESNEKIARVLIDKISKIQF